MPNNKHMKMEEYFSNNIYKHNKKNKMEDFNLKEYLAENKLLKEDYTQKKYTEEEWKSELDLNVRMAARLIDYQSYGGSWQDLMDALMEMQNQSIIPSNISYFKEWIESQEDNKLPNMSSGSFFTGLTDIDGLLSAMNFEEEDNNGEELYTDEEYEAAQKYHTDKINQELPDWSKY